MGGSALPEQQAVPSTGSFSLPVCLSETGASDHHHHHNHEANTNPNGIVLKREFSRGWLAEDLVIDSPDFLRGVPTNLLLRRLGVVFQNGEGRASTFQMSARVDEVDVFLSHSWQTSRWLKTVALLYRSNVNLAVLVPFLMLVCVQFLRFCFGGEDDDFLSIPMGAFTLGGGGRVVHMHVSGNCLIYSLFFFLVLALGSELRSCFGKSTMFFLDKCCIHQTDPEKKMRGIRQLGGILARSQRMLILWQPEYLTRLWCVYELAAFSSLGRDPIVEIIPLKLPLLVIGLFCFHLTASAGLLILGPKLVFSEWWTELLAENLPIPATILASWLAGMVFGIGLYIGAGLTLWKFFTWHMEDRHHIVEQLRKFKVKDANCFLPQDRELIERSIGRWFGSIAEFEKLVQEELRQSVEGTLQSTGPVPYTMLFVGCLSHALMFADALADSRNHDPETLFRLACVGIVLTFCTDAIGMYMGLRLASKTLERGSPSTARYSGPLAVAASFACCNAGATIPANPHVPFWLALLMVAGLVFVTIYLYLPPRRVGPSAADATSPTDASPSSPSPVQTKDRRAGSLLVPSLSDGRISIATLSHSLKDGAGAATPSRTVAASATVSGSRSGAASVTASGASSLPGLQFRDDSVGGGADRKTTTDEGSEEDEVEKNDKEGQEEAGGGVGGGEGEGEEGEGGEGGEGGGEGGEGGGERDIVLKLDLSPSPRLSMPATSGEEQGALAGLASLSGSHRHRYRDASSNFQPLPATLEGTSSSSALVVSLDSVLVKDLDADSDSDSCN